jgi:hypothetical protein
MRRSAPIVVFSVLTVTVLVTLFLPGCEHLAGSPFCGPYCAHEVECEAIQSDRERGVTVSTAWQEKCQNDTKRADTLQPASTRIKPTQPASRPDALPNE